MKLFSMTDHTDYSSFWGHDDVQFKNGYFILNDSCGVAKRRHYSPMNYYHTNVPIEIVNEIIGKPADLKLHMLFAALNINDNRQICNWTKHFGVVDPVHGYPFNIVEREDNDVYHIKKIPEKYVKYELFHFQLVLELYNFMQHEQTDKIIDFLMRGLDKTFVDLNGDPIFRYPTSRHGYIGEDFRSNIEHEKYIGHERMKSLIKDKPYPIATEILSSLMFSYISNRNFGIYIAPNFKKETNVSYTAPLMSWNFESLSTALYFMLALDISENQEIRKCENPLCGITFPASRNSSKYCSDTCKNRAKQQRHRAKTKATPKNNKS